jgi:hypothetical protein
VFQKSQTAVIAGKMVCVGFIYEVFADVRAAGIQVSQLLPQSDGGVTFSGPTAAACSC